MEGAPLLELPFDVYLHLFQYLQVRDLARLSACSRELKSVVEDPYVWREQLRLRYNVDGFQGVDQIRREEIELSRSLARAEQGLEDELDWRALFQEAHRASSFSNPRFGPRLRSDIEPRQCHSAARAGDYLVVFAGFTEDLNLYVLDCVAQMESPEEAVRWLPCTIRGEGPPNMLYGHSMVTLSPETMLVYGGMQAPGYRFENPDVYLLHMERIDSWRWERPVCRGAPPPAVGYHQAVVCGGRMYVFGGISHGRVTNSFYALDLATFEWHEAPFGELAPAPGPRQGHSMTALDDSRFLLLGGTTGTSCQGGGEDLRDVFMYDTAEGAWMPHDLPRCPVNGVGRRHAAVSLGSAVVTIGGSAPSHCNVHVLDLLRKEWVIPRVRGRKPIPRVSLTAHLVLGKIFMFGGCLPSGNLSSDLYLLDPCSSHVAPETEVDEQEEEEVDSEEERYEQMMALLLRARQQGDQNLLGQLLRGMGVFAIGRDEGQVWFSDDDEEEEEPEEMDEGEEEEDQE